MAEHTESAHGKLSPEDQRWDVNRFLVLLFVTLIIALILIYIIAGLKSGDFSYQPFAHDLIYHTFETSQM
jgi:hypothetical protein